MAVAVGPWRLQAKVFVVGSCIFLFLRFMADMAAAEPKWEYCFFNDAVTRDA